MKKAKITFENENGTYTIEVPCEEVAVYSDFLDTMVIPLSLVAQWTPDTINRCFSKEFEIYTSGK